MRFLSAGMIVLALTWSAHAETTASEVSAYPPSVKESFMKPCMNEDQRMKSYCECVLDNLQKELPVNDIETLSKTDDGRKLRDQKVQKSAMACIHEIK